MQNFALLKTLKSEEEEILDKKKLGKSNQTTRQAD